MVTMPENDPEIEKKKGNTLSREERQGITQELDKFKRRLIRSVARLVHKENRQDEDVWKELKKETGSECKILWVRMRALTVKKLQRLLLADDVVSYIPSVARMTFTDWLLFDLVLVHEKIDVIGRYETRPESKALGDLFNLVQRFHIENQSGDELMDSWTAAVKFYNRGRMCSPMLLQKRWYQLKEMTRYNFYTFWHNYRGNAKLLEKAKQFTPSTLQRAIATRYPHVITAPFETWEQLIEKKKVILPEEFENRGNRKLPHPCNENDPDLILVEQQVETIDLDKASDDEAAGNSKDGSENNSKSSEINTTDSEIIKDIQELNAKIDENNSQSNEINTKETEIDQEIEDLSSRIDIKTEPIEIDYNDTENQLSKSERLMLQEDETLQEIENAERDIEQCIQSNHENAENETEPDDIEQSLIDDDIIVAKVPFAQAVKEIEPSIECEKPGASESTINNVADKDLITTSETTLEIVNDEVMLDIQNENTIQTVNKETIVDGQNENALQTIIDVEETSFETQLPLITNVIGNVDIEGGDLTKLASLDDESAAKTSTALVDTETQVVEDEDDIEDIIQVNDYGKQNETVELEPALTQLSMSDDKNNDRSNQSEYPQTKKLDVVTNESRSVEEAFIDDDIELVDDGIVEVDSDDSTSETDKNQRTNKEDIDCKESPTFDLKLLMNPVIYTTKLDQMGCLKGKILTSVSVHGILDDINAQSKPESKESVKIKVEKEVHKIESIKTKTDDIIKSSDDDDDDNDILQSGDCQVNESEESEEVEEVEEHLKVKRSCFLFKKPMNRQYHPIQLCKNPDFNTRLRWLNLGFFSHTRNIRLLKFCKPLTVDVYKGFENKLVNGTLYLKEKENDDKFATSVIPDTENVQVTHITPSAVSVQSLVNSTETDANEIIAEVQAITSGDYNTTKISEGIPTSNSCSEKAIEISLIDSKINNEVTTKSPAISNLPKNENNVEHSSKSTLNSKYLTVTDTHPFTINQKNTKKNSEEFSKKVTLNYRTPLDRRGANWLAQGIKPKPAQIDDFLIAGDTLTKMLVLMDGGGVLSFQDLTVMKLKKMRSLNRATAAETEKKHLSKTTPICTEEKKTKKSTKEHSDSDVNCTCVVCVDNCSCPACQPKETIISKEAKKIKKKRVRACRPKIVPALDSQEPRIEKEILTRNKAKPKTTPVQVRRTTTQIDTLTTTQTLNRIEPCMPTETEEISNQKPVAHIRILPKNIEAVQSNSIAVQADPENIHSFNQPNLFGNSKTRHIVIDGTKPLNPKPSTSQITKNAIYLGKNKILMTTTKFPPALESIKERKSLPNSYSNLLHPNLQLPPGVNLKVLPQGDLSLDIEPDAVLTAQQRNMLPIFLETMQKFMTPTIINSNSDKGVDRDSQNTSEEIIISDDDENVAGDKSSTNINITNLGSQDTPVISSCEGIQENTQICENINQELSSAVPTVTEVEMQPLKNLSEEPIPNANCTQEQSNNNDKNHNEELNSSIITEQVIDVDSTDSMENICQNKEAIPTADNSNNQEVSNQSVNQASSSVNRKSLLSDLMEMSGISIDDVLPATVIDRVPETVLPSSSNTVNEAINHISAEGRIEESVIPQIEAGLQVAEAADTECQIVQDNTIMSQQTIFENKPDLITTDTTPKMYELNVVSSYAKLKYVCENNGDFFKLDLDTGIIYKINVCIKKKTLVHQTQINCEEIDLTDEPDTIEDLPETENPEKPDTIKRLSERNNLEKPDPIIRLSERKKPKRVVMNPIRVRSNLFPTKDVATKRQNLKILKPISLHSILPNILKKQLVPKKTTDKSTDLSLVIRQGNKIRTLKASFNQQSVQNINEEINLIDSDMEPMEEEHLIESDESEGETEHLLRNQTPQVQLKTYAIKNKSQNAENSHANLQSDDDSDDEPLAKKAKRIHGIDDNNGNSIQSTRVTTIINQENNPQSISNTLIDVNVPQIRSEAAINNPENFSISISDTPITIPEIISEVPVLPISEPMSCDVLETLVPANYIEPHVFPTIENEDDQNYTSESDQDCILGF